MSYSPTVSPSPSYEERLATWSAAALGEPGAFGRWMLAGELDSPIPSHRLEEVRSRPACTLEEVLAHQARPGQLLIIADEGPAGWLQRFVAAQARSHQEHGGPPPVWIRGWALDLSGDPQEVVNGYLHQVAGPRLPPSLSAAPRLILLERPDLAFSESRIAEGVRVRSVLNAWARAFPDDWLVVVVGAACFVAHDPYPGCLLFQFEKAPDRVESPGIEDAPAFRDFVPPEPLPRERIHAALAALQSSSGLPAGAGFAELYQLLAAMPRGHPLDQTFFHGPDLESLRPHRATLESWLRSLVRQELDGLDDREWTLRRSPARDARVAARLYVLADAVAPKDERKTSLVGCDAGSWFCFLRAFGYEQLAVVLSRMERETFAGVNLMHAPPLAFGRFRGADFSGADLYRVDFSSADLREACFAGADLSRSHLKRADLRGADLRRADVSYSSLELADLRGADLTGANQDRCIDTYAVRDS
jgi:Pentapeptide repeats (8 copies)